MQIQQRVVSRVVVACRAHADTGPNVAVRSKDNVANNNNSYYNDNYNAIQTFGVTTQFARREFITNSDGNVYK